MNILLHHCSEQDMDVSYKPSFTKRIQDVDTVTGLNATFTFKAIGEPTPEVTWFHDDVELKLIDRITVTKDGSTHRLVITQIVEDDAGCYKCVISNVAGKSTCSAQLLVEGKIVGRVIGMVHNRNKYTTKD